jgi:hypothetical protein
MALISKTMEGSCLYYSAYLSPSVLSLVSFLKLYSYYATEYCEFGILRFVLKDASEFHNLRFT